MKCTLLFICLFTSILAHSQLLSSSKERFSKADSLHGTYSELRNWWDLKAYDLFLKPDYATKSLSGQNTITFTVIRPERQLQIDLQKPMRIDSIFYKGEKLNFIRQQQGYLVSFANPPQKDESVQLRVYFHGSPREATNPPWDGGLIWTKDDEGNPWISEACQGLGASVWWPCKDHGADEPEQGARISLLAPEGMKAVSNGRLVETTQNLFVWEVKSPINNYNITMNMGNYTSFDDSYEGLSGKLSLQYWFLAQHSEKAKKHLQAEAKEMLKTFEYWFGPYPFYEDGYKLIETPFLGMEHQSGIAYGNQLKKGYLGDDRSGSGWGTKWDYILVHESGHEWFGNSISARDVADLWIHEAFTTYSEVLFVEGRYGKKAADAYAKGLRMHIENDKPIIGKYGVNNEGSGDMYDKGVQLIHTYRQILNDDQKFRSMLQEMNKRFYHQTVATEDIENLMQEFTDINLNGFFDTYLRSTKVPTLKFGTGRNVQSEQLSLWFVNVEPGFIMPVNLKIGNTSFRVLIGDEFHPGMVQLPKSGTPKLILDTNYFITF